MLVTGPKEVLLSWAARVIGVNGFREDARVIARVDDAKIRAVVVFDTFGANDCNIHIASDGSGRWISRELLQATFHYPFVQCGLKRLTGLVAADNQAALRFDEHLGFRREGYHPQAGANGEDLISLGLLRR